jgi:hydrogenase nickel incorporation protein HypB
MSAEADSSAGAAPHVNASTGDLHFGAGPAKASVPGLSEARSLKLEADVLGENARLAAINRAHFLAHGVTAYDLVSSPGSGKTTLLCSTIASLARRRPSLPVAVIEGDQQTSLDADRIRETGVDAIQVNTGKGCHLDARMIGAAFERLGLHAAGHHTDRRHAEHEQTALEALLLIENVGNLVCPALWDLGEAAKVVILSVTEGDDKPLKYPDMFAAARLMVINKIDLLPYVNFDVERCIQAVKRANPTIDVLSLSATTGEGMDSWVDWLLQSSRQHDNGLI